jgi:type IV secretory pathway TrbL component
MFRALLRLVILLVVVAAAIAFFMGYRLGDHGIISPSETAVGTTGRAAVDTARARETGAAIGEKVASGANQAERAIEGSALTAKIKSKMALDDTVKALDINVDTTDAVVTLTGTVHSEAERTRAVQLARETAGVKSVTDHLTVR